MRWLWSLAALMLVLLAWAAVAGYRAQPESVPSLEIPSAASPIAATPVSMTLSAETPVAGTYPPLDEVRDLWVRPWTLEGQQFSLTGTVSTIRVAPEGYGYELGDDKDYRDHFRTVLILGVSFPNGGSDVVTLGSHGDLQGIYEDDVVVVAGRWVGTHTSENQLGGEVTHPLIIADHVERVDEATP